MEIVDDFLETQKAYSQHRKQIWLLLKSEIGREGKEFWFLFTKCIYLCSVWFFQN